MKRRRRLLRYIRTLAIAGACLAVFTSTAVAGGGRTKPVLSRHAAGPVVYRAGDSASSRVPGSAIQPVSEPFVTRTVVNDDSDQTPVLILAGSALAIALSGAALVVVRLNRTPVGLH